jgi:outer membrane receptor protein involved in Fe transport
VDQCRIGNQTLCALVTRDGGGVITLVTAGQQNVSRAKVAGVDVEANYTMQAFGGSLTLRGIATYLDTYRFITPGAPVIEQAGTSDISTGTRPHWRGNLQATWRNDAWTVALQERWVGPVDRVAPPTTVDDNSIPSTFYTNLTVRYRMEKSRLGEPELFLTVANLFNQAPRVGPTTSCSLGQCQVFDGSIYDTIGRYYTVGFRSRF